MNDIMAKSFQKTHEKVSCIQLLQQRKNPDSCSKCIASKTPLPKLSTHVYCTSKMPLLKTEVNKPNVILISSEKNGIVENEKCHHQPCNIISTWVHCAMTMKNTIN